MTAEFRSALAGESSAVAPLKVSEALPAPERQRYEALSAWLHAQGAVLDGVEAAADEELPGAPVGLRAARVIEAHQAFMFIPASATLNSSQVRASRTSHIGRLFEEADWDKLAEADPMLDMPANWAVAMAAFLLEKDALGDRTWAPYLDAMNLPLVPTLFWALNGAFPRAAAAAGRAVDALEVDLERTANGWIPSPSRAALRVRKLRAAQHGLVALYSQHPNAAVRRHVTDPWKFASTVFKVHCRPFSHRDTTSVLVPGLDLFNHRPDSTRQVAYHYREDLAGWVVVAPARMSPGEHGYVSYIDDHGAHAEHLLLFGWGIAPPAAAAAFDVVARLAQREARELGRSAREHGGWMVCDFRRNATRPEAGPCARDRASSTSTAPGLLGVEDASWRPWCHTANDACPGASGVAVVPGARTQLFV